MFIPAGNGRSGYVCCIELEIMGKLEVTGDNFQPDLAKICALAMEITGRHALHMKRNEKNTQIITIMRNIIIFLLAFFHDLW